MKRIAGIFLAALLALTVLPHGAELVTSDDVTKGIVTTAYAEDALGSGQVSIGGMVLDGSNRKYYKNGGTEGSASDYDAKFENGVLTLNELELKGQIVSNGDLTIVVHAKGATIDYTTTETGKAAIQVEGNLKVTYNSSWSNLTINTTGADAINATGTVSMGGVVVSAIAINGSGIVAGGKVDIAASARVNVKGTYGIYSKVNATYDGISVHGAACVTADAVETGLYAPNGRVSVSDSGGVLSNGQKYGVYGATVSVGHHMVAYGGVKAIEGTLSLGGETASAFVIKSGATSAGAMEKDEVESCVNDQYVLILWKHENDPSDHRAYCEINFSSNGGSGTQEKEMVLWGTGCSALPECTITPPEGKVFNGWSLEMGWSGETITSLTPAQTARGYLQLYATWKNNDSGETTGHVHAWSASWATNETAHWHVCTALNCYVRDNTQKDGYGVHTAGAWETVIQPTDTADGKKQKKCTECGYVMGEETIPATGGSQNPGGEVTPGTGTTPRYYYNSTAAADTKADGSKTGSPKTFDAGVGIYAVSAVLSLTGMAYVGKKKF